MSEDGARQDDPHGCALRMASRRREPVVSLDKRQLEGAPAYDVGDELAWGDRAYESKIHD
jgi:hypothetical protein